MIDFRSAIREVLLSRRRAREHTSFKYEPGVYHPSGLWRCMRRQFFDALRDRALDEAGRPPVDELNGFMALGTLIHDDIAEVLAEWAGEHGAEVESEVPLRIVVRPDPPLVFSAHADDIVLMRRDGSRTILELKTVNTIPEAPRRAHVAQLNVYLHAFPGAEGALLYISRRTFEMRQFEVRRDPELYAATVERAARLDEAIRNLTAPPPEAAGSTDDELAWECSTCPYLGICAAIPEGVRLWPREFAEMIGIHAPEALEPEYAADVARKARFMAPHPVQFALVGSAEEAAALGIPGAPVPTELYLMWDPAVGQFFLITRSGEHEVSRAVGATEEEVVEYLTGPRPGFGSEQDPNRH
ncbi:MAG: CRISPR-associated protein Cas4 [Conexivisphaera sp.]